MAEIIQEITDRNTTSLEVTGLLDNKTYYYKVYQKNKWGVLSEDPVTFSIHTNNVAPDAVVLSSSTQTPSTITLDWTKTASEHDFQFYRVYKSLTPGVTTSSTLLHTENDINTLTYTDTNLLDNITYYYNIVTYDNLGANTLSNELAQITVNIIPPAPTLDAITTFTTSTATLTWSYDIHDFAAYKIYRSETAGVTDQDILVKTETNVGATSYVDIDLIDNKDYYYVMYVEDTGGLKTVSNEVSVHTANAATDPSTLSAITVYTDTSVDLSWTKNINHDFDNYKIYRDTNANVTTESQLLTTISDINTLTYQDTTDVLNNVTYYYRVFSYDNLGANSGSNTESVLTTNVAPLAVTASIGTITGHTVQINWTKALNRLGDPLHDFASYKVYQSESSDMSGEILIQTETDINVLTFTATNLKDHVTYYFRVDVVDSLGLIG